MRSSNLTIGYLGSADQYFTWQFLKAANSVDAKQWLFFSLRQKKYEYPIEFSGFLWRAAAAFKRIREKLDYCIREKALRKLCQSEGIEFISIKSLEDLKRDKNFRLCDVVFTSGLRVKIDQAIFSLPKFGIINLHYALLPNYRGTFPLFWQAVKRDRTYGFTYHRIDDDFDKGILIYQSQCRIECPSNEYARIGEYIEREACSHIQQVLSRLETTNETSASGRYFAISDFENYITIDLKKVSLDELLMKYAVTDTFLLSRQFAICIKMIGAYEGESSCRICGSSLLLSGNGMQLVISRVNYLPALFYLKEIGCIWKGVR